MAEWVSRNAFQQNFIPLTECMTTVMPARIRRMLSFLLVQAPRIEAIRRGAHDRRNYPFA